MVLVVVLVVIAMLTLAGFTFTEWMMSERQAVQIYGRKLQAAALADSGVEAVKQFAMLTPELQQDQGGRFDNPGLFRAVVVADDPSPVDRGSFTIIAPKIANGNLGGIRFGLENESARLNLNVLLIADTQQENGGRTLLMNLPGMTEAIADAIMDWIDPDSDPREFGAEVEFYSGLAEPYAPNNGPPETVEELLLVRDVTPLLLFGPDSNRNGQLDLHESAAAGGMRDANGDDITHGWADYMTLYSAESNLAPDGTPKIDLNGSDAQVLYTALEEALGAEIATFIVAYRQNGPYTGTKTGQKGAAVELDLTKPPKTNVTTVLDLIGQRAQVTPAGAKDPTIIETPFPKEPLLMNAYLPLLLDWVAVNTQPTIPARININEAPRAVLLGIPGLTPEIVDEIIAKRDSEPTDEKPERRHETWLMSEGLITLEQMKAIIPYVTSGGRIFRAQVVGFYEGIGPVARSEVIVDASGATARVLLWRDLTHLGRGYSWDTLGATPQ